MATAANVLTWAEFQRTPTWDRLSAKRKIFLAAYLADGDLAAAAHAAFDCKTERHATIMGNEALRAPAVVAALRLWRGQNQTDREIFIEEVERAVAKSPAGMVGRCGANPSIHDVEHYRDVTVCERWRDFKNFLADMWKRPEGTTLGRFGDVGDYCKDSCAWQSDAEQKAEQKKKRQLALVAA